MPRQGSSPLVLLRTKQIRLLKTLFKTYFPNSRAVVSVVKDMMLTLENEVNDVAEGDKDSKSFELQVGEDSDEKAVVNIR
jgi:hypothetical protein